MPMNLLAFPFDFQQLDVHLISISHWSTHDGSLRGSVPRGQAYSLQPVTRDGEGDFLMSFWDGNLSEWHLNNCEVSLKPKEFKQAGFVATDIIFSFNMSRSYESYMAKFFGPLFAMTLTSFALHMIPIAEDGEGMGDRINCSFTMFLAAFSLIYTTSSDVPKVAFFTYIDVSILLTLVRICPDSK